MSTPPAQASKMTAASASDKLWTAVCDCPDSTAAFLAKEAGIGLSTTGKLLVSWSKTGFVVRTRESAKGKPPIPALWAAHPSARTTGRSKARPAKTKNAGKAVTVAPPTPPAAPVGQPARRDNPTTALKTMLNDNDADVLVLPVKRPRLVKGALRDMVADYVRDTPGEHTPAAIGKALNRSGGAVANALEKLTDQGTVRRVCDAPKRYAALDTIQDAAPNDRNP